MGFMDGKFYRIRGVAHGLIGLSVIFNFGAFFLTVYMLEYFPYMFFESNPLPAYIFANYGYWVMFLLILPVWLSVFLIIRYWSKIHDIKNQALCSLLLSAPLLLITSWDFNNNFQLFVNYVLPSIIN